MVYRLNWVSTERLIYLGFGVNLSGKNKVIDISKEIKCMWNILTIKLFCCISDLKKWSS